MKSTCIFRPGRDTHPSSTESTPATGCSLRRAFRTTGRNWKKSYTNEEFLFVRKQMIHSPSDTRRVISLRYFEGKSNREIAEILDINEGTIKSLLSRGLRRLREKCNVPGANDVGRGANPMTAFEEDARPDDHSGGSPVEAPGRLSVARKHLKGEESNTATLSLSGAE